MQPDPLDAIADDATGQNRATARALWKLVGASSLIRLQSAGELTPDDVKLLTMYYAAGIVSFGDLPANTNAQPPGHWTLPDEAIRYAGTISAAAREHGIPFALLARVLWEESRFRQDIIDGTTRSPAGALGIAQFMPATAAELGIDPLKPGQAIDGCARYLRRLYDRFGTWRQAVAAYNWGQGNVNRYGLAKAPEETQRYMREVLTDVFGTVEV